MNSVASGPNCNFGYRNCRLWTGVGCLYDIRKRRLHRSLKMFSEDQGIEIFDSSVTEFLNARDGRYKWRTLEIPRKELFCWGGFWIPQEAENIFELLERKFNIQKNVCLTDKLQYYYHFSNGIKAFLVCIEYLEATVIKGRHNLEAPIWNHVLKECCGVYGKKTTSILSHRINRPAHLADNMLFRINAGRLPTNKIISFKNLVLCYDGVERVNHRGKEKHHIVAKIISGQVLLPEEYQYIPETE